MRIGGYTNEAESLVNYLVELGGYSLGSAEDLVDVLQETLIKHGSSIESVGHSARYRYLSEIISFHPDLIRFRSVVE